MQPDYYQPNNYPSRRVPPAVKVLYYAVLGMLVVVSIALLVMWKFGYGHLVISAPADASVSVNGHVVQQPNLKLRPGSYGIEIRSAANYTSYQKVQVSMFSTKNYSPSLSLRTAASVVQASDTSLQGSSAISPIWLKNNTWLVAITGRGGSLVVASHYQNNRWQLAYGTADLQDSSSLPNDVSAAISQLNNQLQAYE